MHTSVPKMNFVCRRTDRAKLIGAPQGCKTLKNKKLCLHGYTNEKKILLCITYNFIINFNINYVFMIYILSYSIASNIGISY